MEETITEAPKRPQFLNVLCILTFIGVGVGIISSLLGWWGMSVMTKMIDQNGGDLEGIPGLDTSDTEKIEQMMVMMKYSDVIMFSALAGCLVCLLGALQMWKLKKMGFIIYAVGEIAPAIVTVVCFGAMSFTGMNLLGLIIPVVFLVLYGLNLKHLK